MSDWRSRAVPADSSWRDRAEPVQEEPSMLSNIAHGAVKALPMVGAVGGGLIGAAAGGIPTLGLGAPASGVVGAGLGAGIGKGAENLIEKYVYGNDPYKDASLGDVAKDYGKEIALGGAAEMGGQVLGKGIEATMPYVKSAGKSLYKSGLKGIDQVSEAYGKGPVSDLLFKRGVTGSAKSIQQQMDIIGDELLATRNDILKRAAKGEVSMADATAPLRARIQTIRNSGNPNLQPLADGLEKQVSSFMKLDGKPSEDILREFPRGAKPIGDRTEITGFQPKKVDYLELPKSKLSGESQGVDFTPGREELIDLPIQSGYQGPYRSVPKEVGNPASGRLAVGQTASKGPFDKNAVQGVLQPETYLPNKPAVGLIQEPAKANAGLLRGPEFNPDVPELASVVTPGQAIPGKKLGADYEFQPNAVGFDQSPATMGPTPLQASGYKTSIGADIPDSAWKSPEILGAYQSADKEFYGGMKNAVEDAVGRARGADEAQALKETNADLGNILTTKEKALMEAAKEANKNNFTSVDGMILGAGNPKMALVKKLADITKMTGPRTKAGMGLYNLGSQVEALAPQNLYRGLIAPGLLNDER